MLNEDILKKVKEVNEKIKKHNKSIADQKALRKIRLEQIKELASQYEKEFGVEIWDEDIHKMKKVVEKLLKEEEKVVKESLAKAEKLLELVEAGDYAGMNSILGIEVEEPEEEDDEEIIEEDDEEIIDDVEEVVEDEPEEKEMSIDDIEELEEDFEEGKEENKKDEINQEELEDIGLDELFDL